MVHQRYESELKRCISEIIIAKMQDPRVEWVTVSRVRLSKDYRLAQVFVSVIEDDIGVIDVLDSASGFIRSQLARTLPWRRIPKIEFLLEMGDGYE